MLILSSADIQKCIQPTEIIEAVKEAILLYETENFLMPDRAHIDYKENTLLMMPAFSDSSFGTKLVSVFPNNKEQGLPPIFGSMLLNDATNGKPQALLNGSTLTAHRTGALGGLAASLLSQPGTRSLGLIGAGIQSLHQAYYISNILNIKEIRIFDLSQKQTERWKANLLKLGFEGRIIQMQSTEEIVKESEIIVSATTSEKPVFEVQEKEFLGKKFLGFGSYKPTMREFPETLFYSEPKVFIDTKHALSESGDLAYPLSKKLIKKENIHTLGKLINKEVTVSDEDTVFFKSVGMALFDLIVSKHLYNKALENNIGNKIEF